MSPVNDDNQQAMEVSLYGKANTPGDTPVSLDSAGRINVDANIVDPTTPANRLIINASGEALVHVDSYPIDQGIHIISGPGLSDSNPIFVHDIPSENKLGDINTLNSLIWIEYQLLQQEKARSQTISFDSDFLLPTSSPTAYAWTTLKSWTVPGAPGNIFVIPFISMQNITNGMWNRLVERTNLATYDYINLYSVGLSAVGAEYFTDVRLCINTTISPVSIITVTYTNESGVPNRTASPIDVAARGNTSLPDSRYNLILQSGDSGVSTITNITSSVVLTAGNFSIIGYKEFALAGASSTSPNMQTNISNFIGMRPGRIMALELASNSPSVSTNFRGSFQGYLVTED